MWLLTKQDVSIQWLLIPAALILFFVLKDEVSKRDCIEACELKGYQHIRYERAHGKYDRTPEHCICLTEDESKMTDHLPKGLKLY